MERNRQEEGRSVDCSMKEDNLARKKRKKEKKTKKENKESSNGKHKGGKLIWTVL